MVKVLDQWFRSPFSIVGTFNASNEAYITFVWKWVNQQIWTCNNKRNKLIMRKNSFPSITFMPPLKRLDLPYIYNWSSHCGQWRATHDTYFIILCLWHSYLWLCYMWLCHNDTTWHLISFLEPSCSMLGPSYFLDDK